ncbi:hypothetical protein A4D02_25825 [Niastella koreensis]|uniref:DUF5017 domain-containing protein n=2 Tax=Niastella koreensis TaxID=354356 RepID=G8TM73_NIAKG|nr:DUF5017 domain-containing protein [Niastella koreensis]AEV99846.1 hypothetical protein Niako_3546 [Niastella koreensis GR20-10]OQP51537.1 hypothetical protein A4D02_25825 [Niastella koreensis]
MQKFLFITVLIITCAACNKKTVESTGFSVTTDKDAYALADTIRFSFTGNPYYLTFYSGEPYHKYEYNDRVTADGVPQLQFNTAMTTGSQTNTLKLLVSTDFSGVYDSTNIYQATWTDVTSKAKLATNSTATDAGVIDLSQFITGDHPVYVAFKFTGTAGSAQRTWTIKSVALSNVLADSTTYSLLGIGESTAGFKSVAMKAPGVAWTISTSQLQIKGGTTTSSPEAEGWVISKPLNLKKVLPDTGTPLKNMTTTLASFTYIYGAPGAYKATFVAANINRYDAKSEVKDVDITVQ